MKQLGTLLAVSLINIALLSNSSFADPTTTTTTTTTTTKKKTTVKTANKKAAVAAATPAPTPYSVQKSPQFDVALAIGTVDGHFAFGPRAFLEFPTTLDGNQFKFGAETGFIYATTTGAKFWSVPLMANGSYLFKNTGEMFKPYIGLSMGFSIDHTSFDSSFFPSDTSVHFALLARPGMSFGENHQWFAELPIGTMFTGFALFPTIGYHF